MSSSYQKFHFVGPIHCILVPFVHGIYDKLILKKTDLCQLKLSGVRCISQRHIESLLD